MFIHTRASTQETDLYWHDCSTIADLSPDGKQALFTEECFSIYNENDGIAYARPTDGSPAVRLGLGVAWAFSPDGKWAMVNPRAQAAQLVALPLRAGEAHPLTADNISHTAGRWLPDSKRIVFTGAEPNHRLRYYVQDSIQSPPRAISGEDILFDRNAYDIVISPDGRVLAAAKQDGSIQLLPIDGGAAAQTVPGLTGLTPVAFCRDESLLVYRSGEAPVKIIRVNTKTGKQTPWKELAPAYRSGLFAIQPVRVLPDCETYGYSAQYVPSTLFVVSGLR